jgi:hypothetical protein
MYTIDPTGEQRRRRAVDAAVEVAEGLGLVASNPVVLKDSNNTIVRLRPMPVVAKVATSPAPGAVRGQVRELDVLTYLSDSNAPVAHLAAGLPRRLHEAAGRSVLLLDYVDHDPEHPVSTDMAREAVASVHAALSDYPGELPAFTDQLHRIRPLLSDPAATPDLSGDDRALLVATTDRFASVLAPDASWRPLHGDPRMRGNLLWTEPGAVVLDFEAACLGPAEWDWSSLPPVLRRQTWTLRCWRTFD